VSIQTVALEPDAAEALSQVRFVNAAALLPRSGEHRPYLHAKALLFEGASGSVLVTGSANPTVAAWTAATNRNAEAVLVRRGAGTPAVAERLGLTRLGDCSVLLGETWEQIKLRRAENSKETASPNPTALCFVQNPAGFESKTLPFPPQNIVNVFATDDGGKEFDGFSWEQVHQGVVVTASKNRCDRAVVLKAEIRSGQTHVGIIHRTEELRDLATPGPRRQLRDALRALDGDATQFGALFKVVEKVVFETPEAVRQAGSVAPAKNSATNIGSDEPLGVHLDEHSKKGARRRLSQGDLALLLDALIRRLGPGPTTSLDETESDREDLGEQRDRSAIPDLPQGVDVERLAKLCRTKSRHLMSRLLKRLQVIDGEQQAYWAVLQTAAVLGMLYALRRSEATGMWRAHREQFVDGGFEPQFARSLTHALAGHLLQLQQAEAEAPFDELIAVRDLLVWLGWDLGISPVLKAGTDDLRDSEEEAWLLAAFAKIAAFVRPAFEVQGADPLIAATPHVGVDPTLWTVQLSQWVTTLASTGAAIESLGRLKRPLRVGDVVHLKPLSILAVVVEIHGGSSGQKVVVADHERPDGTRTFKVSAVEGIASSPADVKRAIAS
jgi:hypothetical protein